MAMGPPPVRVSEISKQQGETALDDPYQTLGVAKGATQDEIKTAYRKLARSLHPDLNPGNKQAEEQFKQVSAAYDLLSDQAKRARFDAGEIDASGAERPRYSYRHYAEADGGRSKYGQSFHFGDNADDIFAELLRRRNKGRQAGWDFFNGGEGGDEAPVKGGEAQYSLRVPFAEAAMGATKRITLPTGKSLDVKVPPGTKDGAVLRLKGQGNPGRNGGPSGDALIEIKVEPDAFFTRDGDDVLVTVPISLVEAVQGAKITVPTVDGKVAITVPAWTDSGTVLRLKGKGIPNGSGRGDQLVTLKLVLPSEKNKELESFIKGWGAKHGYDPRAKLGVG